VPTCCCLSPMIAQVTGSPKKSPNASQVKKLIARLEGSAPPSSSATTSSHSPSGSPRRQPQSDAKFEAEHNRGASITSQSSIDTVKMEPEVSPEQGSKKAEELPAEGPRESTPMPPEDSVMHSQHGKPPHPPINNPTSPTSGSNDHHPSPLDALLSPTTPSLPQTPSLPRDSVAGSDLGSVRLDDDERFSTVSLNAAATRDSTVALKSPTEEGTSKPWTEDEPPPAPSEVSGASSMRASFLLQRLGNDVTPGQRRSLDGQQKLQEVFERAHQNSNELEEAANVDWGKRSLGFWKYFPAHAYIAFWGTVMSGAFSQCCCFLILIVRA
jgi:hypothetical protein